MCVWVCVWVSSCVCHSTGEEGQLWEGFKVSMNLLTKVEVQQRVCECVEARDGALIEHTFFQKCPFTGFLVNMTLIHA